jgi:hypothetical protein
LGPEKQKKREARKNVGEARDTLSRITLDPNNPGGDFGVMAAPHRAASKQALDKNEREAFIVSALETMLASFPAISVCGRVYS